MCLSGTDITTRSGRHPPGAGMLHNFREVGGLPWGSSGRVQTSSLMVDLALASWTGIPPCGAASTQPGAHSGLGSGPGLSSEQEHNQAGSWGSLLRLPGEGF